MQDIVAALPSVIAAMLYLEVGALWLRIVMITDASGGSRALLLDLAGNSGIAAAVAAALAALSAIVAWPAFMIYGWVTARFSNE